MSDASLARLVATATIVPTPAEHRVDVDVVLWAELRDGQRVRAQAHGFGMRLLGTVITPGAVPPVEEIDVRNVLIPDDDADPEPLPWAWLVDELAQAGLTTTEAALRSVPYDVEFFAGTALGG